MRPDRSVRVFVVAFGLWHGAAILFAPYPDSALRRLVHPLVEPYLRLAYLDHRWTFFGPRPDGGRLVRYEVRAASGAVEERLLSEAVDRAAATWFRWQRLFDRVAIGDEPLQRSGAEYLCRRHRDLQPQMVRFVVLHQLTPGPALVQAGLRATDEEALSRAPGRWFPCPVGPRT